MPYKEKIIEKKYYAIGEVAQMFNVATSLIRFWETEFDIIKPKKNRKGNRQFTKEDIENVRLIYHLVKERGFTLQGAKDILKSDSDAVKDKMDMIDSLTKVKEFLMELKQQIP
ncbi:MerR family transcriptional regulator [Fulvivirga sediminis]|uniref:MerR family transcriptional regulator n=1 Tax=Fulvivirga sediminis TaxID=2803949 RepID=A0A937K063_9BACT|nr:MerR family transcriptional regulator [Fulvivirga sediminis]MBL3657339.1 MerR family transcriptional regulator [Fulvivirga sediminis]